MSKEKKPGLKKKTGALDIVSRIITCGLAVAIPAAAYFLSLIYYQFDSTAFAFISKFIGGKEGDTGVTYGYITVKRLVSDFLPTLMASDGDSEKGAEIWAALEPLHSAIYATGILMALSLVTAVVIFFVSALSNSNKLPLILAVVGLAFTGSVAIAFRGITAPIIDGSFPLSQTLLSTLLGGMFGASDLMSILGSLVGSVSEMLIKFTVINLSTAWVTMLVCYLIIIIWQGSMLVISIGEKPKAPKVKE